MVDINKVYERVLFVANKEQRGYITPDEFNSYATQAQLEVFESYFIKKFQTEQAPGTTDDYSDISANVEEKITFFDNTITIDGRTGNIYAYPENFYRLALISVNGRMADEVSHKDLTYINLSPLTAPTVTQPVFSRHEGGLTLYPLDYTGAITMTYVRKPVDPVWAYMDPTQEQIDMGVPDEPIYNSATSTQFELHPADEQDLVYKILTMAGVAIKQQDIAGYGQGKDQQIQQTEG